MDKPENVLACVCPVPCTFRGKQIDGYANKQPSCCTKCDHRSCTTAASNSGEHQVCSEGLSFYVFSWLGEQLILNGLIVEDRNHILAGSRRKDLKRLWIKHADVVEIIGRMQNLAVHLMHELLEAAKETISFLHDVRSSVGILLSNCEKVISQTAGPMFSDKLTNLRHKDPPMFSLYQSINLLTEQLSLADVISNPESIEYGQKSSSSIHPFMFKMVKLFQAKANARGMHISIGGNADVNVSTYQSFQLVPLIILDNAVKYGAPGTNISVEFSQASAWLDIAVTSFGDLVPEPEREAIFRRHVRGSNAAGPHPHGTGLGLFLASEIVRVHGYSLSYHCDPARKSNTFTLRIPQQEWADV